MQNSIEEQKLTEPQKNPKIRCRFLRSKADRIKNNTMNNKSRILWTNLVSLVDHKRSGESHHTEGLQSIDLSLERRRKRRGGPNLSPSPLGILSKTPQGLRRLSTKPCAVCCLTGVGHVLCMWDLSTIWCLDALQIFPRGLPFRCPNKTLYKLIGGIYLKWDANHIRSSRLAMSPDSCWGWKGEALSRIGEN